MTIIGELFRINEDSEWTQQAVCAEIGYGDLWFPEAGESSAAARNICMTCPVRSDCLKYAFDHNIRDGVFGGFTARDRVKLCKGGNPLRPGRPGTAFRENGHSIACKCYGCVRRSA